MIALTGLVVRLDEIDRIGVTTEVRRPDDLCHWQR
jgi:hypothetical protein